MGNFKEFRIPRNLPVSLETISRKSFERIKGYFFNVLRYVCKSNRRFLFLFSPPFPITKQGQFVSFTLEEISFRLLHFANDSIIKLHRDKILECLSTNVSLGEIDRKSIDLSSNSGIKPSERRRGRGGHRAKGRKWKLLVRVRKSSRPFERPFRTCKNAQPVM